MNDDGWFYPPVLIADYFNGGLVLRGGSCGRLHLAMTEAPKDEHEPPATPGRTCADRPSVPSRILDLARAALYTGERLDPAVVLDAARSS